MSLRTTAKPRHANPRREGEKRCSTCRKWKPLGAFGSNRHTPDGLTSNCRSCKTKYQRERSDEIPRTSAELLEACDASPVERSLVLECVAAMCKREAYVARHFAKHGPETRATYETTAADRILTQAGIAWRRQVPLLSAAIALARESGLTLDYTIDGKLRRGLRGKAS